MLPPPPTSTLFPYTTLFRSAVELLGATAPESEVSRFLGKRGEGIYLLCAKVDNAQAVGQELKAQGLFVLDQRPGGPTIFVQDRKSTRLNSSHQIISYAVFCL